MVPNKFSFTQRKGKIHLTRSEVVQIKSQFKMKGLNEIKKKYNSDLILQNRKRKGSSKKMVLEDVFKFESVQM